jgi:hypothetical protein
MPVYKALGVFFSGVDVGTDKLNGSEKVTVYTNNVRP